MHPRNLAFILIFCLVSLSFSVRIKNGEEKRIVIDSSHLYLKDNYLSAYSVPTSKFKVTNNGGNVNGGNVEKAFDRNFGTTFKSGKDNGNDFANTITVTFDNVVTLDKVLYQSENWYGRGFPVVLTLHFKNDKGQETKKLVFETETTNDIVVFLFGENISCKSLVFEYTKVSTRHKFCATAREIIFYQPESDSMKDFMNLFDDYCMYKVNEKVNTEAKIENLRNKLKSFINYEDEIKPSLDRAIKVIRKEIQFDKKRQFTTSIKEKGTLLRQFGNLRSYALNTLRFIWYGINKQTTGIQASYGTTLTVYVEANENDPIPQFTFTQFYGSWKSWQSRANLKRGINKLSVPNFVEHEKVKVITGGPVYLENPYTPEQQSSNVKVYIEGGSLFPVFRKGDDEKAYKENLKKYVETYDKATQFDMTETEGRNILHTVRASFSSKILNSETNPRSPQQNLEFWDDWLIKLLTFYGVKFNENDKHYNEMNWKLGINIRMAQPFAAAFAYTDHVGIFNDGWEGSAVFAQALGWGFAHEVGHTLDGVDRTVSECSNNMISKYEEVVIRRVAERGDFDQTLEALTSDKVTQGTYWNKNRLNFLIWWLIESYHIGYWGESENQYRYNRVSLEPTEKQIYYASLIVGFDLSYYFERWGYNLKTNEAIFTYEKASDNFKAMMDEAAKQGKIKRNIKPKIWYYDKKQYTIRESGTKLDIYSERQKINPISVDRVRSVENGKVYYQYTLLLPRPANDIAHLGYEILEGNDKDGYKVVGFNYGTLVTDKTKYPENEIPSYKIKAYDRALGSTAISDKISYSSEPVCRIGNTKYNSVSQAIEKAKAGDTIYLLKDFIESGIQITKNINIEADPSVRSVSLKRGNIGALITVKGGATLTIKDKKVIIDGKEIKQNGPLISVEGGNAILENLTLQNNINTGFGGAILKTDGNVNTKNVLFKNNKATNGGAIAATKPSGSVIDEGSTFDGNEATSRGGAVHSKSLTKLNSSTFVSNKANQGGAISNYEGGVFTLEYLNLKKNEAQEGGAFYIDGRTWSSHNVFNGNKAEKGGAIFHSTTVNTRAIDIKNNTFTDNVAYDGNGDIYLNTKHTTFRFDQRNYVTSDKSGSIYIASSNFEGNLAPKSLGFDDVISLKVEYQGNSVVLTATDISVKLNDGAFNNIKIPKKAKISLEDLDGNENLYLITKGSTFVPKTLVDSPSVSDSQLVAWIKGESYYDDEEIRVANDDSLKMAVLSKAKNNVKITQKKQYTF